MTAARCATKCGRPARGGTICPGCCHELVVWLRQVPAAIDDLETSLARQTASGRSEGGRSSETPMAYGVKASEVLRALGSALVYAARFHDPLTLETGRLDPAGIAEWLIENITEVRLGDHSPTLHARIKEAMSEARAVIDRPPDRWYAGTCGFDGEGRDSTLGPCVAELYVDIDDAGRVESFIRCPTCDEQWDVQERRNILAATVSEQVVKAATLSAALTMVGREVPAATVRSWIRRGKLISVDVDVDGRPLYRTGDALAIVAQAEAKAAESQHVDIVEVSVVEPSNLCNTLGVPKKATPEADEGSQS